MTDGIHDAGQFFLDAGCERRIKQRPAHLVLILDVPGNKHHVDVLEPSHVTTLAHQIENGPVAFTPLLYLRLVGDARDALDTQNGVLTEVVVHDGFISMSATLELVVDVLDFTPAIDAQHVNVFAVTDGPSTAFGIQKQAWTAKRTISTTRS